MFDKLSLPDWIVCHTVMPNPTGNVQTLKKYQPKWKSGATRTIRVPIALTDQILDYAHRLDEGMTVSGKFDQTNINQLILVIDWLKNIKETPRNNFSKQKRELLGRAIQELEKLIKVN